uniref:Uncharacterized protein n=1 Tax=Heliothis virescens TaxID=7102 RepID=A0A2A4JNZ6_HELVI
MNSFCFSYNFTTQTMYYSMSHQRLCEENMAELRQRWRVRVAVNEYMSQLSAAALAWLQSAYRMHWRAVCHATRSQIRPGCQPTR